MACHLSEKWLTGSAGIPARARSGQAARGLRRAAGRGRRVGGGPGCGRGRPQSLHQSASILSHCVATSVDVVRQRQVWATGIDGLGRLGPHSRLARSSCAHCEHPTAFAARAEARSRQADGSRPTRGAAASAFRLSLAPERGTKTKIVAGKRNSALGGGGGNTQGAVRTKRQQTGRRGGTPSTCCLVAP